MSRLLVVSPNWLGDAIMAQPAIADIRRARPDARLIVAARPSVAPVFSLMPEVDEVVVTGGRPSGAVTWLAQARPLAEVRCDAALLFPNSFQSALMVARAGIPERWGFSTDWRSRLLTRAIPAPRGVHQAAYYQHLTTALGMPPGPLLPRVTIPEALASAAARTLVAHGVGPQATTLMALAPGAAFGGAKRWPPEHFADLARGLAADGVVSVLVGSPADRATGAEILRALGDAGRVVDLIGKTDIPTLAAVLARCAGLVTNDSGAMHLAAALGLPITAVFGPTNEQATPPLGALDPGRSRGPSGHAVTPVVILTTPVWCRPCMLRECPLDHRCMRGTTPERVLDAARRVL